MDYGIPDASIDSLRYARSLEITGPYQNGKVETFTTETVKHW